MDHYVFVTLSMEKYELYGLYGSVCMEISGSIARVLIRIHPNLSGSIARDLSIGLIRIL